MASKQNARKTSVRTPTKKRKGHPQTNPNSLANLMPPWKAGEPSPNPSGKPKLLGESYKEYLATLDEQTGRTRAQDIAKAMGVQALQGDVSAAREIRSATEGDKMELTAKEGLTIHIVFEDGPDNKTPQAAPETSVVSEQHGAA